MTLFIIISIIIVGAIFMFEGVSFIINFVGRIRELPEKLETLTKENEEYTSRELQSIQNLKETYELQVSGLNQQCTNLYSSYMDLRETLDNFIKPLSNSYQKIEILKMFITTSNPEDKEKYRTDYVDIMESQIKVLERELEKVQMQSRDHATPDRDHPYIDRGPSR